MSVYIDRKYLGFISHKLERYSQKNTDLYNFRCPFCLDSKKNRSKARGYIYRKGNDYFFRCHNCGAGTTFSNFLKDIDASAHKEYVMERYTAGDNGHSPYKKPTFDELRGNAFKEFSKKINLKSISELPENHYARTYIQNRAIPIQHWDELYFTDKFKDFLDQDFPDHGKDAVPNDDRIILFYKNEKGEITNIAGRGLSDSNKLRYITIRISNERKIFGLHRLVLDKPVYLVEGQFDSLFLDNGLASGDSNLIGAADSIGARDITLIFDNEPRNKEIVDLLQKAIDLGKKVVIFPTTIKQKDINEMVLAGYDINKVISENTFSGPIAKLKFIEWKRC